MTPAANPARRLHGALIQLAYAVIGGAERGALAGALFVAAGGIMLGLAAPPTDSRAAEETNSPARFTWTGLHSKASPTARAANPSMTRLSLRPSPKPSKTRPNLRPSPKPSKTPPNLRRKPTPLPPPAKPQGVPPTASDGPPPADTPPSEPSRPASTEGPLAPSPSPSPSLSPSRKPALAVPAPTETQPVTLAGGLVELGGFADQIVPPVAKASVYTAVLVLLVVLFVAVHHRIDQRDPKLALAPTHEQAVRFVDRMELS